MNYTGSKWWKVDFHVHTPASNCYEEKNITPKEFLINAMQKKIDCLVISDHEDCSWIEPLRNAYLELKTESPQNEYFREITIFPAFEYGKSSPGAHLLCIFDIDIKVTKLQEIIGKLSETTIPACFDIVAKTGGILIPAHVENDNSGLFKKMESEGYLADSLISSYLQSNFFAIECCDYATKLPQKFIDSKIKLSKVVGSDSHSLNTVGSKFTWIKMAKPNITALRLALFDSDDGAIRCDQTTIDPNYVDNIRYIKSITISNAKVAGNKEPLHIEFSPWLNTVIGGRGSGKSSLVNFIRVGLSQTDGMDKNTMEEFDSFNKVSSARKDKNGMLKDLPNATKIVTIVMEKNLEYKYTYEYGVGLSEEIKTDTGEWKILNENATKEHLVSIFNQKQIYNMAMSQNSIMNHIDDMCSLKNKKDTIQEKIERYIGLCSQIRSLEDFLKKKDALIRTQVINNTKLEAINKSSVADLFKELQVATEFKGKVNETNKSLAQQKKFISQLKDEVSFINFTSPFKERDIAPEYLETELQIQNYVIGYNDVLKKLLDTIVLLENKKLQWDAVLSNCTFKKLYESINSKYTIEVNLLKERNIESDDYQAILDSNEQIRAELSEIEKYEQNKIKLCVEKNSLYDQITDDILELNTIRKSKIQELNSSNKFLEIELLDYANIEDSEESFRNAINKNDETFKDIIRTDTDSTEKKGLLNEICSKKTVEERLQSRNELINNIMLYCNENKDFKFDAKFKAHCKKTFDNNKDLMERLVFWYPESKLNLTLKTGRTKTTVSSGSAGQRVAGMLAFLLSISDKPIIIDQPEDDLDTKFISSFVVEKFKTLKNTQQLIIVTHNPNIPVNAAAENIISMAFKSGQIVKNASGALQSEDVRKDICSIMEGGKIALDNRYFRVSKALSND